MPLKFLIPEIESSNDIYFVAEVKKVYREKSKQERFENVIPYIEAGNVFLPDESFDNTIEDDIDELLRFPNGTHDDFVDMLSQYLLNYEYRYGGKIDTDNRFSLLAKAIRGY